MSDFHHRRRVPDPEEYHLNAALPMVIVGVMLVVGLCFGGLVLGDPVIGMAMLTILVLALLMLIANVMIPWLMDGLENLRVRASIHEAGKKEGAAGVTMHRPVTGR